LEIFWSDPTNIAIAICKIPKKIDKTETCDVKCSRGGKDPSLFTNKTLKNHLEKSHPEEYKEFITMKGTKQTKDKKPSTQSLLIKSISSDAEITAAICQFFFKDGRPFTLVEDEGFRNTFIDSKIFLCFP